MSENVGRYFGNGTIIDMDDIISIKSGRLFTTWGIFYRGNVIDTDIMTGTIEQGRLFTTWGIFYKGIIKKFTFSRR
mgnify:CR=1 FL=1